MSSFHERYQAWRELHREPAMQFRALCQKHLPPEHIVKIDRMLRDAHGHKLYWHWWSELRTAAPLEAQTVCPIDHQDVLERFNGYCTCCHLMITKPVSVKKVKQSTTKQPAFQLALEV
ncbi:hypothetical protein [Herpetosiphon geysericola]|uniref:Uncharacterized protein n=1 Tax=Herpetosiphon geysericola TaxID=70996 RepID=A0A0P6XJ81_9CHLR|nr:hypothetical protein [Herpetosiphon geysericola]KPL80205.1 hypothetical protein SE18_24420 [Herpetosiphon geysericola]